MFPVRDTFIDVNEENISPAEIKTLKNVPTVTPRFTEMAVSTTVGLRTMSAIQGEKKAFHIQSQL